ncbi:SLC13 family permease [soil metagenome]
MSPIAITLILLFVAILLFATERLPVDVVGLILVVALVMTGVLGINDAVAGFGNEIILTIGGLFILVGGVIKTGLVDQIGRRIFLMAGNNQFFLTALIMGSAAIISAFINNTTTAAMLLPVVIGLAAKAGLPPSKLLMPMAFGTILGGSCTLIGTSTNLAVSGALQRYGYGSISMFELAPVGIIVVAAGILYMLLLGMRMLPSTGGGDSLTDEYSIREYISELLVLPDSRLIRQSLEEANLNAELGLSVLGIIRGDEKIISPDSNERIQMMDLLIVEGKISDILGVKEQAGLEIKPDFALNDVLLESDKIQLYEVLVMAGSRLIGRTLKEQRFRQRYDLTVLAINRHRETIIEKLSEVRLRFGDVLLVQGSRNDIDPLVADGEILLLDDVSARAVRVDKKRWAIAAFLLFLALSMSGVTTGYAIPVAVCVLAGVFLMLATKTVRYDEMYSLVDFRLLVLIACMMSFGVAMENTGADKYLAGLIESYFGQFGPTAVLGGFFLLTVLLTQPMSNQAAALVVLPVAVKTALAFGLSPRPFAIIVALAASFSFITPLEPACILVYTPGRYRFMDFVKIGSILTIIVFAVAITLVPIFWPL